MSKLPQRTPQAAHFRGGSHMALVLLLGMAQCIGSVQAQQFDPAWADSVTIALGDRPIEEADTLLAFTKRLARYHSDRKDDGMLARTYVVMSGCHDLLGTLDSAMIMALRAVELARQVGDPGIRMRAAVMLSSVYLSMEEFEQAQQVCATELDAWSEGVDAIVREDLLYNEATARAYLGQFDAALLVFEQLGQSAQQRSDTAAWIDALINIGSLHGMSERVNNAEERFLEALRLCRSTRCPSLANLYQNLATVAGRRNDPRRSLALLDTSMEFAMEQQELELMIRIEEMRASTAHELGLHDLSWEYQQHHLELSDSLLNIEKVHALADVQEKYESEKKVRQIKELEIQNLDGELMRERVTRTRNIYLFSGIGVLLLAGGLWSRLRYVHRSRRAIQKEKDLSESLLHNILPEEVADELRAKGYADAREFERATILFTDFKGFTSIAEKLSATQLVSEIDTCFKAFDAIVEKFRVEKIKTIGDAYMASGGLPDPTHGSPNEVIYAALDMQEFMARHKAERIADDSPAFEMRVGIHTGPVVAGIVGVKKFAYDIWGDAVNTASRMESSGGVGEVNISADTYALVKDDPALIFIPRGHVQAKGKGEMAMYFVKRA